MHIIYSSQICHKYLMLMHYILTALIMNFIFAEICCTLHGLQGRMSATNLPKIPAATIQNIPHHFILQQMFLTSNIVTDQYQDLRTVYLHAIFPFLIITQLHLKSLSSHSICTLALHILRCQVSLLNQGPSCVACESMVESPKRSPISSQSCLQKAFPPECVYLLVVKLHLICLYPAPKNLIYSQQWLDVHLVDGEQFFKVERNQVALETQHCQLEATIQR